MSGRKLKLTNELIEVLLKAGNTYKVAYNYLGIAERTFFRWLSEGENADKGIKRQFWQMLKASEAHAHIKNVDIIQNAAKDVEGGGLVSRKALFA